MLLCSVFVCMTAWVFGDHLEGIQHIQSMGLMHLETQRAHSLLSFPLFVLYYFVSQLATQSSTSPVQKNPDASSLTESTAKSLRLHDVRPQPRVGTAGNEAKP